MRPAITFLNIQLSNSRVNLYLTRGHYISVTIFTRLRLTLYRELNIINLIYCAFLGEYRRHLEEK